MKSRRPGIVILGLSSMILWSVSLQAADPKPKPAGPMAVPSQDETVRRLLQQVQRLEARVADLEKKLSAPPDVVGGVGKLATDVVGGTLNMAGQTLDATGRLLTGQPPRKPQENSDEEEPKPAKKEKPTFFGIPIK